MRDTKRLTAQEAAAELGVNLRTLYTYVSRGLIKSTPAGPSTRTRYYDLEDVLHLQYRKQGHSPAPQLGGNTVSRVGEFDSSLTLVANGSLFYRGRDALELAEKSTCEEVAALLWTGAPEDSKALFSESIGALRQTSTTLRRVLKDLPEVEAFQALLALAAAGDPGAYDLRPSSAARRGVRIIKIIILAITGKEPSESMSIAEALQQHWAPGDRRLIDAINYALIVCADMPDSPSTLAVRCVAAARCTPYATVMTGLSTLLGLRRGRSYERAWALFDEIGQPDRARSVLDGRLRRGEEISGFGNLLSESDPRGPAVLQLTETLFPDSPAVALAASIREAAGELLGEEPNIDMALVALCRAMGLPASSGPTLIALSRTIGWIAHTLEEYTIDRIILPHTHYRGPRPRATRVAATATQASSG
ncbi:MAG TPA: citrate synthase [Dehalococcoidia bacterium]